MYVLICAHSTIETEYIPTSHNQSTHSPIYLCMCAYVHIPLQRLYTSPQATIKQHTLLNICAQSLYIPTSHNQTTHFPKYLCTICAQSSVEIIYILTSHNQITHSPKYLCMCAYVHNPLQRLPILNTFVIVSFPAKIMDSLQ